MRKQTTTKPAKNNDRRMPLLASLIVFSWTSFTLTGMIAGASGAQDEAHLVVPGKSIGKITLGMTEHSLLDAMGKPTTTDKSMPDFAVYTYKGTKHDLIVLLNKGKVQEVNFDSPSFKTKDGLSISRMWKDKRLKRSLIQWRHANYRFELEGGGLTFYNLNADSPDPEYPQTKFAVLHPRNAKPLRLGWGLEGEPDGGWKTESDSGDVAQ